MTTTEAAGAALENAFAATITAIDTYRDSLLDTAQADEIFDGCWASHEVGPLAAERAQVMSAWKAFMASERTPMPAASDEALIVRHWAGAAVAHASDAY